VKSDVSIGYSLLSMLHL